MKTLTTIEQVENWLANTYFEDCNGTPIMISDILIDKVVNGVKANCATVKGNVKVTNYDLARMVNHLIQKGCK